MDDQQLKASLEALLFIAGSPVSVDRLKGILEDEPKDRIEGQLQALKAEYEARGAGIMLAEVANGWQLATCVDQAPWVRKFKTVKVSTRLSRPALETLAIIAYKQPVTRPEIEAIRGVNIGGIVRNLMERRLVKIVGKKDVPGKPMLYGTSTEFLEYFGLKDLSSLPTLKEFQELDAGEDAMLPAAAATTDEADELLAAGAPVEGEDAPEDGENENAGEADPAVTSEASQQ